MQLFLIQDTLELSAFGRAFLFILGGTLFALLGLGVARLLAPSRPNPEKLTSYECGEDPVGDSGMQFNMRFYVIALIFLIFEVEILFLFPWSTVFADVTLIEALPGWGLLALVEMLFFVAILLLGLVYVWIKKDLSWIKAQAILPKPMGGVPLEKYQQINRKYAGIKAPGLSKKEELG